MKIEQSLEKYGFLKQAPKIVLPPFA